MQSTIRKFGVFFIFLFPSLGGLLFGYDIGSTSFVIVQLKSEEFSGVSWYNKVENSSVLQGLITSAGVGGAFVAATMIFKVADIIGRRKEMLLASILFFTGSILETISGTKSWSSGVAIFVLILGRWIFGIGCGFATHGAPAYIAEMSPASIRGVLVSLKEAMIVLGMVLGYSFGYGFQHISGGWRVTYGVSSIVSIIYFMGVYYLPPSARWLTLQGRYEEAKQSLKFVMTDGVESAFLEIKTQSQSNNQQRSLIEDENNGWFLKGLLSRRVKRAFIAGVGVVFLQQISGQPSVLYYADIIFSEAGVATFATVSVGIFKLVATLFASVTVENYGRKKLLLIGISLMLTALVILTGAFANYSSEGGMNASKIIIILAMFLYVGGYQVGFGPIAWLLISEIFPLDVRGKAVAVAVQVNFGTNLLIAFLFSVEIDAIGACATFAIFGIITLYSLYFVYKYVPETKGLTLEQIERLTQSPEENDEANEKEHLLKKKDQDVSKFKSNGYSEEATV